MADAKELGFGTRRLVENIIKESFKTDNPSSVKLGLNDILFIIQEMHNEEGKKYVEGETTNNRGFNIFRMFAKHLLYRNLANYDSMVLLTSDKGCLTDDSLLMMPRDLTKYPVGVPLKELIEKGPIKVYSFNKNTKKLEIKDSDGVEFAKYDDVYELELITGQIIKATADHPFLLMDGTYKELKDLKINDKTKKIVTVDNNKKIINNIIKSIKHLGKQNVYDVVNVRDNHNFIANGFVVSNTGKCMYFKDKKDFVVSADGDLKHPNDVKEIVVMDQNMKLQTSKVKKTFKRPEQNVYDVVLRSGKNICLTKEHPLYTINGWKALENLKVDDFIATPRTYKLKNVGVMNKGLVKVLAYLIADGYLGGRKIEFTKFDNYIIDDFKKSLFEYDKTLIYTNPRIITTTEEMHEPNGDFSKRNNLINYCKKIGLYNKRSGEKFIPKCILTSTNELIALFLNRLYSCDGGVEIGKKSGTKEINYTSKSELLIKQLQHLLLRFSITSKKTKKFKRATNAPKHKGDFYYQLTISGKENIIEFYNNIGFYQQDKNKKLTQIYDIVMKTKSNTNVDVIPAGVLAKYDCKYTNKIYADFFNIKKFYFPQFKKGNISLKRFKKFSECENEKILDRFANSDIFWDRIISITKIENTKKLIVYDLEVDNPNHNFVANDVIIHNSNAAIVLAREWCKLIGIRFDPERHLAYTNANVMDKIDKLRPFEPIVCISGDSKIKIKYNNIEYEERIDNLINMKNYEVLTYNIKINKFEYKIPEKTILQPIKKNVILIKLENNKTLKITNNHLILTKEGYKKIKDLTDIDEIKTTTEFVKIKNIKTIKNKIEVYDIINILDNHNFVANNIVIHNCDEAVKFASSADWAKKESKQLKEKLAQVRTKHLLFILCFPLKIMKIEKNYLECLHGDTLIHTRQGLQKIKHLENKSNIEVLSYDIKNKKYEYQFAEACVKTKNDIVFEIITTNNKIKATKNHSFFTNDGWKQLHELTHNHKIFTISNKFESIIQINKDTNVDVYDILNVNKNKNYVANNLLVHNSFVNYWVDLFGRGLGSIYVKDKNPSNDPWRLKDFKNVGSYTEFTSLTEIEKKLKKHPNFWKIIKFPKAPNWLYTKYLKVRERNVYDEDVVRSEVSSTDIYKSLLLLALQDIMVNDTTLTMNRITLHVKNQYDIPISKKQVQQIMTDAKQLIMKIREEQGDV